MSMHFDDDEEFVRPRQGKATPDEVTPDLLLKACQSNTQRVKKNEPTESFLGRVTHITLNNRKLSALSKHLRNCQQARVLYAYDNFISRIEHIDSLHSLTHLYLQNNNIEELSGLGSLRSLSKLYLDGNMIACVEGLDNLQSLEELHISGQRLPEGVGLQFEQRCMMALSRRLVVLSAARCGIADVAPLVVLSDLRRANLAGNLLHYQQIEGLESLLANMERLTSLDLRDNPVCHMPKYRDNIILMSQNLVELDEKPISGTERQFLLQLHIRKLKREQALERREEAAMMKQHLAAQKNGMMHMHHMHMHPGAGPGFMPPDSTPVVSTMSRQEAEAMGLSESDPEEFPMNKAGADIDAHAVESGQHSDLPGIDAEGLSLAGVHAS